MTQQQTTAQKLTELGFTDELYQITIGRTAQVMHKQIDADPDLADRVFDTISDTYAPYPVEEHYDVFVFNWINEQATALHNERAKDFLAPFKAIASLF